MVQNDIRFVFTAPLTPDGEIAAHVAKHGDGVQDIAFAVDDVEPRLARDHIPGAASALEPTELDGGREGVLRRTRSTPTARCVHSFIDRNDYHGTFAPGYHRVTTPPPRRRAARCCSRSTTAWATSGSAT